MASRIILITKQRIGFAPWWSVVPALLLVASLAVDDACAANPESGRSDARAAVAVFGEDVLSENAAHIRERTRRMNAVDRYQFLLDWVLPSASHDSIRLTATLTPADPVPPLIDDHPVDRQRLHDGVSRGQRRIPTGANPVSPAFDLIDAARELGRADELARTIERLSPVGEVQQRCRLTLLALTFMTLHQEDAAATAVDELYARFLKQRFPGLQDRWPETLFVWRAVESGQFLTEAEALVETMIDSQIRKNFCSGPQEWNQLIDSLHGRIEHQRLQVESGTQQPYNSPPPLSHWHPVTRTHSSSDASGIPPAHWHLTNRVVAKLSSRSDEYLWFDVPLRGDFTVECECTGFGYLDAHPSVAGTWIAPSYHHESVDLGGLLRSRGSLRLTPKLSQVDHWIRYRVQVRSGVCSRYLNGRLIHEERLPVNHSPWVAIRSPSYGRGQVRDVRITGSPGIPDEISLSELPPETHRATGSEGTDAKRSTAWPADWMPWFDSPWSQESGVWGAARTDQGTEIVGRCRPELAGTGAERLFRYHWPMVWDATVDYEFYYEPGRTEVHPAIGLQALLVAPDGLKSHWVTNGDVGAEALGPLNSAVVSAEAIPLNSNAWNRMSVCLEGDDVRIVVNGTPVGRVTLHPTSDRRFGLFYDCGESEARVRNVVLKGAWPSSLPPLMDQELRDAWSDPLDREAQQLPQKVMFDFTRMSDVEFRSRFAVFNENGELPGRVSVDSAGLRCQTKCGINQHCVVWVTPAVLVDGDFDLVASFAGLNLSGSDNGVTAIGLTAEFPLEARQLARVFRGMIEHPGIPRRELMQGEFYDFRADRRNYYWHGIYAEECRAGRLRIARRGREVTLMLAEYDSDSFRHITTETLSDEPLQPGNIRLRTGGHANGTRGSGVSVVWKGLEVRAERIDAVTGTRGTP